MLHFFTNLLIEISLGEPSFFMVYIKYQLSIYQYEIGGKNMQKVTLKEFALLAVTGGESFIERSELCAFIMGLFGFDIEDCY